MFDIESAVGFLGWTYFLMFGCLFFGFAGLSFFFFWGLLRAHITDGSGKSFVFPRWKVIPLGLFFLALAICSLAFLIAGIQSYNPYLY